MSIFKRCAPATRSSQAVQILSPRRRDEGIGKWLATSDPKLATNVISPRRGFPGSRPTGRIISGKRLVEEITIGIYQGEILAVIMSQRVRKIVLPSPLNRLDEPTSGTVSVEGTDTCSSPHRNYDDGRFRYANAISLPRHDCRRSHFDTDNTVKTFLKHHHLSIRSGRSCGRAEGRRCQSLRRRGAAIALARTIANSPNGVTNERTNLGLDEEAKEEWKRSILKVLRQNALTCVIVSHDMAQAARSPIES